MGQVDEGLEDMLIGLQVDPDRAKAAAKKQTFDQFDIKLNRLDALIGTNAAYEVIAKGPSTGEDSFIDYTSSQLEDYFKLAGEVAGIVEDAIMKEHSESWYAPFFYSIQSLNNFLEKKDEIVPHEPKKDLALYKYHLFHSDNEQSRDYLDFLIRNGEVKVGDSEHWRKSEKPNGPRGNNILKRIIYELTMSFEKLELGKPGYEVNYGQNKLTVDAGTQQNLRSIRDRVNNP